MIIDRLIGILCPLSSSVVYPNDLHSIQQSVTGLMLFVSLSLSLSLSVLSLSIVESRMSFACYCSFKNTQGQCLAWLCAFGFFFIVTYQRWSIGFDQMGRVSLSVREREILAHGYTRLNE